MKKILFLILVIGVGITIFIKERDTTIKAKETTIQAKAVFLIDAKSNDVLYEYNQKESLPIASLSKLMTQYLVLNAIKNGTLTWESTYTPSVHVQQLSSSAAIVKIGMEANKTYTVKELFNAMTVSSANDAAIALAEMVAGTEEAFVAIMNQQAKTLGMKETKYYNASGLDGDSIGQENEQTNLSSARDIATLADKLLSKHPEVLEFTGRSSFKTSAGVTLWSTNHMLPGMPQAMPGIDGLKTGYTVAAGSCFVGTGVFNNRRIISVVMGVEPEGTDNTNPRFNLTRELLERYVLK